MADLLSLFAKPNVVGIIGLIFAALPLLGWLAVRARARIRVVQGKSERRYIRWFLDQHSTYWNPYLDDAEPLRLDRTYIPLSVDSTDSTDRTADGETHRNKRPTTIATTTIGRAGNVVIVGDAGSGKTTTLKAYGVAAVQGRGGGPTVTPVDRGQRAVPFFVPTRTLAASLQRGVGLAEHLTTDVLGARAEVPGGEARELLSRLLRQRRCVVLLDGLDEVTGEDYKAVHAEVHRFAQDRTPELPTANARLVITCRHDNFLRIGDGWVGAPDRVAERVYALASLRDAEILSYLNKLRDRFTRSDGPEHFMAALRDSENILSLHRTPLVLAMSVGLYARRAFFEIPHSIAELYNTMINDMLSRHEIGAFRREDKLQMLREFSLTLARDTGFGPFAQEELVAFTHRLRRRLLDLGEGQVDAFVGEIIERSGLLSRVSERTYKFAHSSIQEHLVASELLLQDAAADVEQAGGGWRELLERATNSGWRQVVLFYTAAADQRVVSPFLTDLAARDVVLAGGCLAGANCIDDVASKVLDELAGIVRAGDRDMLLPALDAMLSATTSPRPQLRVDAADLVYDCLTLVTNDADAVTALGGNIDGVLRVITALADRAGQIGLNTTLVSRLAAIVPDDPRLVEPLWRCLAVLSTANPSADSLDDGEPVAKQQRPDRIVERLLMLATDRVCFEELQRQPTCEPAFATPALRGQAYPFRNGVDATSNLVTLLCWDERLGVTIPEPNRFLDARDTNRVDWARIEADRNRPALSVRVPNWPRLRTLDRHLLVRVAGIGLSLLTLTVVAVTLVDMGRADGALDGLPRIAVLAVALVEFVLSVFMIGVGVRVGLWQRKNLWRANPFVDAYDDPRSRHWLEREEAPVVS
jgi:NACHT domain